MQESMIFREAVSEKRLLNVVKEVSNFHRIQASPMFREAANHVLKICKNYGLDAKILSYEADPDVWYLQNKMFKEWAIKEATLDLVDPEIRLADYSAEAISVIQKSYPIDRRNDPVELIMLEKGADESSCKDIDFTDKFVFIRGNIRQYNWLFEKGALGVVTDFIMETKNRKRSDLYDSLTYTSFWHAHSPNEPESRGFVLSPKTGDMLEKLCREKKEKDGGNLKVRPYIDASLYNGHIEIVEVTIPGKDDKTVYLSAHLCHPRSSCNDNASGVSATIEAMNVINRLVREGKIEAPQHTIKLTLIPEFTGTFAYLSDHTDYAKGLGAMNMDMVGGKQTRFYGPITLTKTPYQTPALINELCMIAMDNAAKGEAYSLSDDPVALTNHRVEPHSGGSDHTVYSDPSINIPCCMLGQWPDLNYHTATDTLDVIDPQVLKFSCLTAVNFAYNLASFKKEDVAYLFNKQDEVILQDKERYTTEYLDGKIDKTMFGSLMYLLKDYYQDCCDFACKLVEGYDVSVQKKHVADMFANWIALYDLKDEYPTEKDLATVYKRNFVGPINRLDDYRYLGYGEALDEYNKSIGPNPFAMMGITDTVTFLIDGKNTVGDIVRKTSLIKRDNKRDAVLLLINLFEKLGLIAKI
ncbi:MAG: DUF4910 domain-containing protein [Erysipelotrichaceae bacterium]|nr:DUF4910 domain-containing protein [Erysipelotrichaceae bacterium]